MESRYLGSTASAVHHLLMAGGAVALFAHGAMESFRVALLAMPVGWMVLSLVAYSLHRFVMHGRGAAARAHALHHASPRSEQLDPLSYIGPFGCIATAWLVAWSAGSGIAFAGGMCAGGCLGYSYFRMVHRLVHTPRPPWWVRRRIGPHDLHHRHPYANFSVTTDFWDWLLRTGIDTRRRTGPRAAASGRRAD